MLNAWGEDWFHSLHGGCQARIGSWRKRIASLHDVEIGRRGGKIVNLLKLNALDVIAQARDLPNCVSNISISGFCRPPHNARIGIDNYARG